MREKMKDKQADLSFHQSLKEISLFPLLLLWPSSQRAAYICAIWVGVLKTACKCVYSLQASFRLESGYNVA